MNVLRRAVCIAILGAAVGSFSTVCAQSTVDLKLAYPDGQTVYFKHNYTLDFTSDHPELVDPSTSGRGIVRILDWGEWVSGERVTPIEVQEGKEPPANQVQVTATIEKAESQPTIGGMRLSVARFPHTLENVKNREFSWRVTDGDSVSHFKPGFALYLISRGDLVPDLEQLWMSGAYPILPDRPVAKGDTWTGRRVVKGQYPGINDEAIISFDSEYKLKDIKEKKGKRLAILEEKRKVRLQKWVYVTPVSILADGEGEAKCVWEIDLDSQLVQKHEAKMKIKRPKIRTAGEKDVHEVVKAMLSITYKMELDRVEDQ